MFVCEQLAEFALEVSAQPEAQWPRAALQRVMKDWFGCAIAGAQSEVVVRLRLALGASPDSVVASTSMLSPRDAAMLHATAAHALESDDIYRDGLFHPGAPVIGAALALAEHRDASGRDLLRAVLVGYEVSTRLSEFLGTAHYRYWHTTGTVGCLGAAAACATLLGGDAAMMAHALATAASFAGGLQQAFRSTAMTKPMHAGHAADTGVWSALAAHRGMTGALDILEGRAGLGAAMAGSPDWSRFGERFDDSFRIEQITFKRHACCGQVFSAVDAVLALRADPGFDPEQITSIEVYTSQRSQEMTDKPTPRDAEEARFSMQYAVAHAAVSGHAGRGAFAAERLGNPLVKRLMAAVNVAVDAEIDAAYPRRRSARVTVGFRDGARHTHFQADRKGDPELPLSDGELDAKFASLCFDAGWSNQRVEKARRLLAELASSRSCRAWLESVREG
ncbi:MmgE/PrpD family protein [Salinicola rhizosphaerae]|uniref:MmgE/PrpD family protein n=1 Tax=Salinicola rhizosphaerae TaxID=1443141 RepID=A0ABQ3DXD4_9GAMM|nr:MmgE/PrpD family protein [Salinicola rhizosphaerae]GHB17081.1 hypothetical protein GCM10009038_14730 [Salinicola rhizosphaerae]